MNTKNAETNEHIGQSRSNAGLELIDPEFMRLVELSLIAMTDYANTRLNSMASSPLRNIIETDIGRANALMTRISEWFDAIPSNEKVSGLPPTTD